jgi:hypothetical protein
LKISKRTLQKLWGRDVQRKLDLLFVAVIFLAALLSLGCRGGPSFADDRTYRAIEREADRNSAGLAVTAADITAGVERIDDRAERVQLELDNLETAVRDSALADTEKESLLPRIAAAQKENAALRGEVDRLRGDSVRLTALLEEEREIRAALSEEHGRREAAAAERETALAEMTLEAERHKAAARLRLIIIILLAAVIIGPAIFRLFMKP